jgi:hypothetical protein
MKILLLSLILFPVAASGPAPQSQSVSAPEALCTAEVAPSECKPITALLAFRQAASPAVESVQFVIVDDAAYKTEKHRVELMRDNLVSSSTGKLQERAFAAPDYLISGPSKTLFELKQTNHMMLSKIYFNETAACHEGLPSASSGTFNIYQCDAELEYAIGFADGVLEGSNNVMTSLAIGQ